MQQLRTDSKDASEGDECLLLSFSVFITIATSLCYHVITRYRNIVKLLHDVKVLVLCESRIVLDILGFHQSCDQN